MVTRSELTTGKAVRAACRSERWTEPTAGLAEGYAQANLVILPSETADEFRAFCHQNPKPCPLLEVTAPGNFEPSILAPGADLRTDVPRYRVFRNGRLTDEPTSIVDLWQDDFVAFVLGCSFTFEHALVREGVLIRHLELQRNVPMFRTNIACEPAGRFSGRMVVSMRPFRPVDAIRAVELTARYPQMHGSPVHLGFPEQIGITDLSQPDFGDSVPVQADELPVFWACGVTPQVVLEQAGLPLAITHAPGHMFVTDMTDEQLLGPLS